MSSKLSKPATRLAWLGRSPLSTPAETVPFDSHIALLDYDFLVWDAQALAQSFGLTDRPVHRASKQQLKAVGELLHRRTNEILQFLELGRTLVVIPDAFERIYSRPEDDTYWIFARHAYTPA